MAAAPERPREGSGGGPERVREKPRAGRVRERAREVSRRGFGRGLGRGPGECSAARGPGESSGRVWEGPRRPVTARAGRSTAPRRRVNGRRDATRCSLCFADGFPMPGVRALEGIANFSLAAQLYNAGRCNDLQALVDAHPRTARRSRAGWSIDTIDVKLQIVCLL